jgi:hypothetical protein
MTTLAARSAEGWLLVYHTVENRDPWKNDDNWHEGKTVLTTVPEIGFSHRSYTGDAVGSGWDLVEKAIREAGKAGTIEIVGEGCDYRRIITVETQAQLDLRFKVASLEYGTDQFNVFCETNTEFSLVNNINYYKPVLPILRRLEKKGIVEVKKTEDGCLVVRRVSL